MKNLQNNFGQNEAQFKQEMENLNSDLQEILKKCQIMKLEQDIYNPIPNMMISDKNQKNDLVMRASQNHTFEGDNSPANPFEKDEENE